MLKSICQAQFMNKLFFLILSAIISFNCQKGPNSPDTTATLPTVTTTTVNSITATTVASGGNISSDGGATVTARGVCWSTTPNPVATGNHSTDGNGIGTFSSIIIGLAPNTTYYARAYATNSVGTAYGNQQIFTTLPAANTITDIDGNIYPIITICNQVWVQKNLNVSRYRNGDLIPKVTDNLQWATLTTGAWCWYNNDSTTYASVYGKLYNWYAVNDARGLVPPGWHIPSESDWKKLEKCVDPSADTTCPVFTCVPSLTGGGSLKESGISHWQNPNTGATNSTGFTGLPGGYRYQSGIFDFVGQTGYWWSSGAYTTGNAYDRYLGFGDTYIYRSAPEKIEGLSVRIIKD